MVLVVAACVESNVVQCEDGRICPAGFVCADVHAMCVTPAQLTDCDGQADRAACLITQPTGETVDGTCQAGFCLEAACGNGRDSSLPRPVRS